MLNVLRGSFIRMALLQDKLQELIKPLSASMSAVVVSESCAYMHAYIQTYKPTYLRTHMLRQFAAVLRAVSAVNAVLWLVVSVGDCCFNCGQRHTVHHASRYTAGWIVEQCALQPLDDTAHH